MKKYKFNKPQGLRYAQNKSNKLGKRYPQNCYIAGATCGNYHSLSTIIREAISEKIRESLRIRINKNTKWHKNNKNS